MTESERVERRLPREAVVSVLSRADHLIAPEITSRMWKRLRNADARIWLFRPPKRVKEQNAVRAYLNLALDKGGCARDRFKVASRKTWYLTPLPSHVDGFVSGMSSLGPWICFCRKPGLRATNTLYVVAFKKEYRASRYAWALVLLGSIARSAVARLTRVYADGLQKIEPGELQQLRIQPPPKKKGARKAYLRAASALLRGDTTRSAEIADEWLGAETVRYQS
jgi:hypothetical protein